MYKEEIMNWIDCDRVMRKLTNENIKNRIMTANSIANRALYVDFIDYGGLTIKLETDIFCLTILAFSDNEYHDLKLVLENNDVSYNVTNDFFRMKEVETSEMSYDKLNVITEFLKFA